MKKLLLLSILLIIISTCRTVFAEDSYKPAKPAPTTKCVADYNGDKIKDLALYAENGNERILTIMLKNKNGYIPYIISVEPIDPSNKPYLKMYCLDGTIIKETTASHLKGRTFHNKSGNYVEIVQEEASAVAYFWNGKGFTEVWTSD